MYIVYKDYETWIDEHKDLRDSIDSMAEYLTRGVKREIDRIVCDLEKEGISPSQINIGLSGLVLKQALIDAYDDLSRLKNFHPIKAPNPIKEISYIAYWLIKRKPIVLMSDDIIVKNKLSDGLVERLMFLNEHFAVNLMLNAAFTGKIPECNHVRAELSEKQEKTLKNYLLYYLVYRLDSPKSLEAIMLSCTIHPIWQVKSVIWNE